jgi:hypothetical protein
MAKPLIATIALNTAGLGTFTTNTLTVGTHFIVAHSRGTVTFASSDSPTLSHQFTAASKVMINIADLGFTASLTANSC